MQHMVPLQCKCECVRFGDSEWMVRASMLELMSGFVGQEACPWNGAARGRKNVNDLVLAPIY